jgi:hypothetical protein
MSDRPWPTTSTTFNSRAADVREERRIALHALHVLEYALSAPAPRRHRTWLHRVATAIDALHAALQTQLHTDGLPMGLLDEIALSNPSYLAPIQRLRQDVFDLTIAVASLREQIELDPAIENDPDDVRNRLAALTQQFRQHQAREADLVYDATGLDIDAPI